MRFSQPAKKVAHKFSRAIRDESHISSHFISAGSSARSRRILALKLKKLLLAIPMLSPLVVYGNGHQEPLTVDEPHSSATVENPANFNVCPRAFSGWINLSERLR